MSVPGFLYSRSTSTRIYVQSTPKSTEEEGVQTDRQLLHKEWSNWKKWYKQQPLGHVRYYICIHGKTCIRHVHVNMQTYILRWHSVLSCLKTAPKLYIYVMHACYCHKLSYIYTYSSYNLNCYIYCAVVYCS